MVMGEGVEKGKEEGAKAVALPVQSRAPIARYIEFSTFTFPLQELRSLNF